jgi:hypothetical protein
MFQVNLMNVLVILVYAYVIFKVLKPGQYAAKVVATLVALALLMCQTEGFSSLKSSAAKLETDLEDSVKRVDSGIKSYMKNSNINTNTVGKGRDDLIGGGIMGPKVQGPGSQMPYDGLCLKTGNHEYWMKSPDNTPLLPNDTLYTYFGSEGPIKMKLSEQAALNGPPVDGVDGSPEKMFMFANNRSSLSCCPSTFSTSTGCICTTENQRDYIADRGGNN